MSRVNANRILTQAAYSTEDKPIIALSLVTDGIGGELRHGCYQRQGDAEPTHIASSLELWAAVVHSSNRGCVWYAHHGGETDYRYLIPHILGYLGLHPDAEAYPIMQQRRIIGIVIHTGSKQRIELRDSHALLPLNLHALAGQFAPHLAHEDVGILVRTRELTYSQILACQHDTSALLAVILSAKALVRTHFGCAVGWTTGATAMRAFRRQLDRDEAYWRLKPNVEGFARRAYHGGLCALTTINRTERVSTIDVNSMYPSVMRRGVPDGVPTRVYREVPGSPAFYRCEVVVLPEERIPWLPYDGPDGRLLWPRGEFTTTLTSDELYAARARGFTVTVLDGYAFPGLSYPFDAWVEHLEELRARYRGQPVETVVKLLQNSLYGKFGSREEIEEYRLYEGDVPAGWQPLIDERTGDIAEAICWRLKPMDAPYMLPHWAAWITAQARLRLIDAIYAIGPEHVRYCDTDSITADRDAIDRAVARGAIAVGTAYGEWKVEHLYDWFHAGAPKEYVGLEGNGTYVVRAAGVPRSAIVLVDIIAALEGEQASVEYVTTASTVSSFRGHGASRLARRGYSTIRNSPNWEADADGQVYAREIHAGRIVVE